MEILRYLFDIKFWNVQHFFRTRKNSSRMRAALLPTIHALVATRCQHWWVGWVLKWTSLNRSPVMATRCHWQGNQDQGSFNGDQRWGKGRAEDSYIWCQLRGGAKEDRCSEIQSIMGDGHVGTALDRLIDRQTHMKILPSRNSIGG